MIVILFFHSGETDIYPNFLRAVPVGISLDMEDSIDLETMLPKKHCNPFEEKLKIDKNFQDFCYLKTDFLKIVKRTFKQLVDISQTFFKAFNVYIKRILKRFIKFIGSFNVNYNKNASIIHQLARSHKALTQKYDPKHYENYWAFDRAIDKSKLQEIRNMKFKNQLNFEKKLNELFSSKLKTSYFQNFKNHVSEAIIEDINNLGDEENFYM